MADAKSFLTDRERQLEGCLRVVFEALKWRCPTSLRNYLRSGIEDILDGDLAVKDSIVPIAFLYAEEARHGIIERCTIERWGDEGWVVKNGDWSPPRLVDRNGDWTHPPRVRDEAFSERDMSGHVYATLEEAKVAAGRFWGKNLARLADTAKRMGLTIYPEWEAARQKLKAEAGEKQ